MSAVALQRTFLDLLTFPEADHHGLPGMSDDVAELTAADTIDHLRTIMEDDEIWQTLIDTVRWTMGAYYAVDAEPEERDAFEHLLMNYGVGLLTLLRMRGRVAA